MAFPTTSILDNFNRADEAPLDNGNWEDLGGGFAFGLKLVSNTATNQSGSYSASRWKASTFGPDCEIFVTAVVVGPTYQYFRNTTAENAYLVEWLPASSVARVYKSVGGTTTQFGADISVSFVNGDVIGASIVGELITLYKNGTSVGTRTADGTYTAAGYLGLGMANTATGERKFDDFGGGALVAGTPPQGGLLLPMTPPRRIWYPRVYGAF